MADKLSLTLQSGSQLDLSLGGPDRLVLGSIAPSAGTRDYNQLSNKPQINGVTLQGNKTLEQLHAVSENTEEGWRLTPLYVPRFGEICVYSDTRKIKIGDGSVPIVDLPFIGSGDTEEIMDILMNHINNTIVHITAEERAFWNAKLNYLVAGEELTFTRN